jgi:hypothetical protein
VEGIALAGIVRAPCVGCTRETFHDIMHSIPMLNAAGSGHMYETLRCRGCANVSLKDTYFTRTNEPLSITYYPPPISRNRPSWSLWMALEYGEETEQFQELLDEIYKATQNDLPRLAMMGVRALLEQVMIAKVGDGGTFVQNLKGFHEAGYISVVQFDVLTKVLDAGHAVMHRGFAPKKGAFRYGNRRNGRNTCCTLCTQPGREEP